MLDFQDRTLLLTGANGGIGRETAKLFAANGAKLLLTDRELAPLQAFADSLGLGPDRVHCLAGDTASADDAQRAVDAAAQHFGGIDFLVPAAGIFEFANLRIRGDLREVIPAVNPRLRARATTADAATSPPIA